MKPGNRLIDISGQRFGSVVAISLSGRCSDGKAKWLFVCDCGAAFNANGSKARSGEIKSCPQCSKERVRLSRVTHGARRTPEYRIWTHIKSRCLNTKVPEYKHYGGRGITICERWLPSFENFLADMGKRPSGLHSIDRKDTNGNYEPTNCRWATYSEQANNTRANKKVVINGETKNAAEWALGAGLNSQILYKRSRRGHIGTELIAARKAIETYSFDGITASIPEWGQRTGIKVATLYWRINTKKWPIERALTEGAKP